MSAARLDVVLGRVPEGVSLSRLAVLAGLHVDHVRQMKRGQRKATDATVARLKLALVRLRARATQGPSAEFCLYRTLLARAAVALGLDPAQVRDANPADKGRTPAARAAAQARWLAFYLMNVGFGLQAVDVARAAGVSKNAVSLALREVELRRETDAAYLALIEALEDELVGEI